MSTALFELDCTVEIAESPLPALVGSEQQVLWATHVRKKLLGDVAKAIRSQEMLVRVYGPAHRKTPQEQARLAEWMLRAEHMRVSRTYAGWWLDRRKNSAAELLNGAPAKPGGIVQREEPLDCPS